MGCVVKATPRLFYPCERESVPIAQQSVLFPRSVWTGAEIIGPQRFGRRTVHSAVSRYNVEKY